MKFFIPDAKDAETAEKMYNQLKANLKINSTNDKRVYSIEFIHNKIQQKDRVGEICKSNNKMVYAIFDLGGIFYTCTLGRGIFAGEPMMTGKNEIINIEYFE